MDRIELVETLEERLKDVQEKRDKVHEKVDTAYQRTWEYIDNRFEITPKEPVKVTFGHSVVSQLYINDFIKDEDKYSLNRVIDLGHQIKECENDIENLEKKLDEYLNKDFVAYLEKVMK